MEQSNRLDNLIPLTKVQIIDETIEYYTNNNRGIVNNNVCTYKNDKGDMCAVGRCLTPDTLKLIEEKGLIGCSTFGLNNHINFDKALKYQYQGHSIEFWRDLQRLHDSIQYWEKTTTGNILTNEGMEKANQLKELYK